LKEFRPISSTTTVKSIRVPGELLMRHILNPKNSQPLDKNLNLAMPTFGPTTREYYNLPKGILFKLA
jgi:hypothetical protein